MGVSPTGHVPGALLARVYVLLQAYGTLKVRALRKWRAQLATPG